MEPKTTVQIARKVKQLLDKKERNGELSEDDQKRLDDLLFELDGKGAGAFFVDLHRVMRHCHLRIF